MELIEVLNMKYLLVTDFNHFRQASGDRRIGLPYYILYYDASTAVLIQQHIDAQTSPSWLKNAIAQRCIYMSEDHFNMTSITAKSLKEKENATA